MYLLFHLWYMNVDLRRISSKEHLFEEVIKCRLIEHTVSACIVLKICHSQPFIIECDKHLIPSKMIALNALSWMCWVISFQSFSCSILSISNYSDILGQRVHICWVTMKFPYLFYVDALFSIYLLVDLRIFFYKAIIHCKSISILFYNRVMCSGHHWKSFKGYFLCACHVHNYLRGEQLWHTLCRRFLRDLFLISCLS